MKNRADYILLLSLFSLTSILLFYSLTYDSSSTQGIVTYNGVVILTFDLEEEAVYEVEGENGIIEFRVEKEKVIIDEEISKYNICSEQGLTDIKVVPIICLPNKIVITSKRAVDEVSR